MSLRPESGSALRQRVHEHLALIYPQDDIASVAEEMLVALQLDDTCGTPLPHRNLWDQTDSILITYGDSIIREEEKPLQTLHHFLGEHLSEAISAVHILPFFPYSSDDGFAVINYLSVNPALGEWEDVSAIAKDFDLMADLVLNHASSRSAWFENFKKRVDPGKDYFFEADVTADLEAVVRPRSSPLLTEVDTLEGKRHVWCTFGPDQVDMNFANPQVLIEFISIIRHYSNAVSSCFAWMPSRFCGRKRVPPVYTCHRRTRSSNCCVH